MACGSASAAADPVAEPALAILDGVRLRSLTLHTLTDLTTRITLRVSPGARRSAVVGRHGEAWKVRVAAPPADGRGNSALQALLCQVLDVGRSQLRIVTGAGSRDKIIEVSGRDAAEADALLSAAAVATGTGS